MSECVVRMEMPQNCMNCDLRYECNAFYAPGKPKPFMKGCRIVCQLPEGHGRLVDAEEMYKKSEAFCNQCRQGEHDCEKCNYIVAQGYMFKSPTIVPADTAERSET